MTKKYAYQLHSIAAAIATATVVVMVAVFVVVVVVVIRLTFVCAIAFATFYCRQLGKSPTLPCKR